VGALTGRKVVVTRAAEQADDLADLLHAVGAVPVVVPLIEIVAEPFGAARLAALAPDCFDWLVVTSPNGAQAYLAAHGAAPGRIAAVGAATGAVLAAAGLHPTLVPAVQRAAGVVAEFPAGDGRVLLVQAVDAEDTLATGLAEKGWQVTVVAPYRSRAVQPTAGQQLRALSADAVLFASGSAARAWVAVFGDASPPIVVAIGPRTAAAVAEAGLKVSLIAADHSLLAMVSTLERHLAASD
jgi:uroporphyrinogen-III synthase